MWNLGHPFYSVGTERFIFFYYRICGLTRYCERRPQRGKRKVIWRARNRRHAIFPETKMTSTADDLPTVVSICCSIRIDLYLMPLNAVFTRSYCCRNQLQQLRQQFANTVCKLICKQTPVPWREWRSSATADNTEDEFLFLAAAAAANIVIKRRQRRRLRHQRAISRRWLTSRNSERCIVYFALSCPTACEADDGFPRLYSATCWWTLLDRNSETLFCMPRLRRPVAERWDWRSFTQLSQSVAINVFHEALHGCRSNNGQDGYYKQAAVPKWPRAYYLRATVREGTTLHYMCNINGQFLNDGVPIIDSLRMSLCWTPYGDCVNFCLVFNLGDRVSSLL